MKRFPLLLAAVLLTSSLAVGAAAPTPTPSASASPAASAAPAKTPLPSAAPAQIEKSSFQQNAYTIYGSMVVNNEASKMDRHALDFTIPAGKIVVLSFLTHETEDDSYRELNDAYIASDLDLVQTTTDESCSIWTGGYSQPSRMRYFRTTEEQNGRFSVYVGVQKKQDSTQPVPAFRWDYTVSVKILDAATFEPLDAQGKVSGDRNFFLSSGPEAIWQSSLYTYDTRQYLCRAPINGNAIVYWSHINQAETDINFGILLQNKESDPLEITVHSDNHQSVSSWDNAFGQMYLDIFAKKNDFTAGLAGGAGKWDEPLVLQPGQAAWLTNYTVSPDMTGETTGVISLSVNDGAYTGRKLICTTYAYAGADYTSYIPQNVADWEVEAQPGATSMRGSGNGAVLNLTGGAYQLPFETVLTGENIINEGEQIDLTRLENNQYYTSDNKTNLHRIACDSQGNLPNMTWEDRLYYNTYNCNFGTIYKIDTDMLQADYHLQDGKKVVGRIHFSARTSPAIAEQRANGTNSAGINIAVWRTKNGALDFTNAATISLARSKGIDPDADQEHFYPEQNIQEAILSRSEEGVYWEFDPNVPFYDDAEYSYYIVASGMSNLPFELSFTYEDIDYDPQPMAVYIDDKSVTFPDVRPQLLGDYTMVPLRGVFEELGASLDYDNGVVSVFLPGRIMTVNIGDTHVMDYDTDNKLVAEHWINTPPVLLDNRTLVPLRAFSELMGLRVIWANDVQQIFLYHDE